MGNNEQDPYYEGKSKKDSQTILFWVCIAIAAMLCCIMVGYIADHFEVAWVPLWAR